jgi:hypothetical protein
MSKAAELAALIGSQSALSNRNLIINGEMQVAQRGTSATLSGDGDYPSIDRFAGRTYGGSGRFSMAQDTTVPSGQTFYNSLKLTVTTTDTSGTYGYAIKQIIEGYNISQIGPGSSNAKKTTLSFWARSSVAGTYCASIRPDGATEHYVFEYTLAADTWKKIEHTIAAPTSSTPSWNVTNGVGYNIEWSLGAQTSKVTSTTESWASGNSHATSNQTDWINTSGATFYLTGVQLELGEQATPFEHRSYADELHRCQRYFEETKLVAAGVLTSAMGDGHTWHYKATKRAAPTITKGTTTQTGSYTGGLTSNQNTVHALGHSFNTNGSSAGIVTAEVTADAEL